MKHYEFPLLLCTAIVSGCNQMNTASSTAMAPSRPSPGYVRLLNLSKDDVFLDYKNRHVFSGVSSMNISRSAPVGTGLVTLKIQIQEKSVSLRTNLRSGAGSTIILMPDGSKKFIENEMRYASAGSNLHVVPVSVGGKMPESIHLDGSGSRDIKVKDGLISLPLGTYQCPDGSQLRIKPTTFSGRMRLTKNRYQPNNLPPKVSLIKTFRFRLKEPLIVLANACKAHSYVVERQADDSLRNHVLVRQRRRSTTDHSMGDHLASTTVPTFTSTIKVVFLGHS
jgi:hypothetical protein